MRKRNILKRLPTQQSRRNGNFPPLTTLRGFLITTGGGILQSPHGGISRLKKAFGLTYSRSRTGITPSIAKRHKQTKGIPLSARISKKGALATIFRTI